MAYISQEEKAKIAPVVKALLKKYNLKGSLSINNHSTLVLTIKAGEIDFIKNYNTVVAKRAGGHRLGNPAKDNISVNPYWFEEHFNGQAKKFLTEAHKAIKGEGWFNHSDSQTDYFHLKHYVEVSIGKWDKPYALISK